MPLAEIKDATVDKLTSAGQNVIKTISNPAFGTFVLVLWAYSIGIELLMVMGNPGWLDDSALWIEFAKNTIKQSVVLFIAILGKVMRMSYQNKENEVHDEMKAISQATLSIMNKCLMSNDPEVREHANTIAIQLMGQGVSLYDHAFHDREKAMVIAVAGELDLEKKK